MFEFIDFARLASKAPQLTKYHIAALGMGVQLIRAKAKFACQPENKGAVAYACEHCPGPGLKSFHVLKGYIVPCVAECHRPNKPLC